MPILDFRNFVTLTLRELGIDYSALRNQIEIDLPCFVCYSLMPIHIVDCERG